MQPKQFIRRKALVEKVGLCASSIDNLERAGKFPKHFLITPRCAVWDLAAVEDWMSARETTPAAGVAMPDPPKRRSAIAAAGAAA
jgi:prophage regulatory protein